MTRPTIEQSERRSSCRRVSISSGALLGALVFSFGAALSGCAAHPPPEATHGSSSAQTVAPPITKWGDAPAPLPAQPTPSTTPSPALHDAIARALPELPPDADAEAEAASICEIDPHLCEPVNPKVTTACGCDKKQGRDRQSCVIDCVARERTKVEKELQELGP